MKKTVKSEIEKKKGSLKTNKGHNIKTNIEVRKTFYDDGSNDVEIIVPRVTIKKRLN